MRRRKLAPLPRPDQDSWPTLRALRRALLAEPGVRVLRTERRRVMFLGRRTCTTVDLLSYARPGGPRRRLYAVVSWSVDIWEPEAFFTRAEAEAFMRSRGYFPVGLMPRLLYLDT